MTSLPIPHSPMFLDFLKAVLREYSRVRKPRAQMVWNGSRRAGMAYDRHGPDDPVSIEAAWKVIEHQYEPVWHHDMDDDIRDIVDTLRANGEFPPAK